MACLGFVLYDPATVATKSTATAVAMTALDTTNARITFTAPANGIVLVKIRVAGKGATLPGQGLLGVLDGATVKGRAVPLLVMRALAATTLSARELVVPVNGLTPGNSYTFDAAYGIETGATGQLGWGGPNNTTASDAYGALSFEVWETENLFGAKHYDPAAAVSKSTASLLAMTALDTTNLRIAFTTPASGAGSSKVLVRLRGVSHGGIGTASVLLGILEGATVKMRQAPYMHSLQGSSAATDLLLMEASAVVAVSPSTSYTWDAAYGVETVLASSALKYGGPDDATVDNAFGGFTFEVWKA